MTTLKLKSSPRSATDRGPPGLCSGLGWGRLKRTAMSHAACCTTNCSPVRCADVVGTLGTCLRDPNEPAAGQQNALFFIPRNRRNAPAGRLLALAFPQKQ